MTEFEGNRVSDRIKQNYGSTRAAAEFTKFVYAHTGHDTYTRPGSVPDEISNAVRDARIKYSRRLETKVSPPEVTHDERYGIDVIHESKKQRRGKLENKINENPFSDIRADEVEHIKKAITGASAERYLNKVPRDVVKKYMRDIELSAGVEPAPSTPEEKLWRDNIKRSNDTYSARIEARKKEKEKHDAWHEKYFLEHHGGKPLSGEEPLYRRWTNKIKSWF